jgi:hypothetical protein
MVAPPSLGGETWTPIVESRAQVWSYGGQIRPWPASYTSRGVGGRVAGRKYISPLYQDYRTNPRTEGRIGLLNAKRQVHLSGSCHQTMEMHGRPILGHAHPRLYATKTVKANGTRIMDNILGSQDPLLPGLDVDGIGPDGNDSSSAPASCPAQAKDRDLALGNATYRGRTGQPSFSSWMRGKFPAGNVPQPHPESCRGCNFELDNFFPPRPGCSQEDVLGSDIDYKRLIQTAVPESLAYGRP